VNVGSDERPAVGAGPAAVTGAVTLGVWVCLGWVMVEAGDGETTIGVVLETVAFLGLPFVVAAAAVAWHVARAADGPDVAARQLALATAGRHGALHEWGAAMRAELAAIGDPRERRRFARGCTLTALRTGWGRTPLLVAAGCFLCFAGLTFATSRIMLTGDREGILAGALVPALVVLVVALAVARSGRSFRAGLESGLAGLFGALAGILVVAVPESVTWYVEAGVWITDGDAPANGIGGRGVAMRDTLGGVTLFYLLFTAAWPVIGAALGAWRRVPPAESDAHRVVPGRPF